MSPSDAPQDVPPPVVRRARRDQLDHARRRRRVVWGVGLGVVLVLGLLAAGLELGTGDDVDLSAAPAAAADAAPTTTAAPSTSTTTTAAPPPTAPPDEALPASGAGRRVVFSVGRQRMWWVDDSGAVLRTSLVSGRPNTPTTGTFQVYSKTLNATGIDGSRMDYFVRFTKGPNGWAIGFHDIPEKDGVPVQTEAQLGEPLSHGCIRQREDDARFTWDYLQVGDTVVVVA